MIYNFYDHVIPELKEVGGKAKALTETAKAGFPVPKGLVLSVEFFADWLKKMKQSEKWNEFLHNQNKEKCDEVKTLAYDFKFNEAQKQMLAEAMKLFSGSDRFAVRSSSPEEDLEGTSFAGGYETSLGVTTENLEQAVIRSFASIFDTRVVEYKKQHNISVEDPRIAVIIQKQLDPSVSGVGFSINPSNGDEEEVMLNANFGLGETIVSGEVTPDIYIVRNKKIIEKNIAHKYIFMTLKKEGGVEELKNDKPYAESLTKKRVLQLAALTKKVEDFYKKPMDIEWAIENGKIYLLQARPITTLKSGISWKINFPKKSIIYARGSISEIMPDPLCPLYADFAQRHVTNSLLKLMGMFLNKKTMKAFSDINFSSLNGYGYYSMDVKVSLMGYLLGSLSTILKMVNTPPNWIEEEKLPLLIKELEELKKTDLKKADKKVLNEMAHQLKELICTYYSYVQVYLARAYMTEGFFIRFYNKKIKPKTHIPSYVFMLGNDSIPILADKALYTLAERIREHIEAKEIILNFKNIQDLLKHDNSSLTEFKTLFNQYLMEYGNMIYDLDFSKPTPFDNPQPIFEVLQLYIEEKAVNPFKRQQESLARKEEAELKVKESVSASTYKKFKKRLKAARDAAPYRENGLANVGLCQPFIRKVLLELGERLRSAGIIEQAEDIFWLQEKELNAFIEDKEILPLHKKIFERKELWHRQKSINPPTLLPKNWKFFGISVDAFLPADIEKNPDAKVFKGNAVSSGKVTGKARVLLSVDEFDEMEQGEILVTVMTTPAWTPLFVLAKGIVTDFGGPLSHSSIVAREYGIPAVLGTGGTSRIIKTGQNITIDGDMGQVTIN